MLLKILNRPHRTQSGTINYRFRELLAALELLGIEDRAWALSGAVVTWPDDLLDDQMEVHDPRVRFSRDGQIFVCNQEMFLRLVEGIAGDWTDIYMTFDSLEGIDLDLISNPPSFPYAFHFECVDAAFWVVETNAMDVRERLHTNGFETEYIERAFWRSGP